MRERRDIRNKRVLGKGIVSSKAQRLEHGSPSLKKRGGED